MRKELQQKCAAHFDLSILRWLPVAGGDINQAFRLDTDRGALFLKYQQSPVAAEMLRTEARGLAELASAGALRTPFVIGWQALTDQDACLLMEYIPSIPAGPKHHSALGQGLARLHRRTRPAYGWTENNFIGSLPQSNSDHKGAADFLRYERLEPQWRAARKSGFFSEKEDQHFQDLLHSLPDRIPEERPALIHGDLWSGNYLIDDRGHPVLIDPAVSYGPREMDLAMSRLFGGFSADFYTAYQAEWPLPAGYPDREPIYQLYYLLVHVNLFGTAYTSSVRRILTS